MQILIIIYVTSAVSIGKVSLNHDCLNGCSY